MKLEKELSDIKDALDSLKAQKIAAESKLKSLDEDKEALLSECTKLGVDPKKIEDALRELESKIESEVTSIKQELSAFDV